MTEGCGKSTQPTSFVTNYHLVGVQALSNSERELQMIKQRASRIEMQTHKIPYTLQKKENFLQRKCPDLRYYINSTTCCLLPENQLLAQYLQVFFCLLVISSYTCTCQQSLPRYTKTLGACMDSHTGAPLPKRNVKQIILYQSQLVLHSTALHSKCTKLIKIIVGHINVFRLAFLLRHILLHQRSRNHSNLKLQWETKNRDENLTYTC